MLACLGNLGRYIAHSSSTLVVNVISKRLRYPDNDIQIDGIINFIIISFTIMM